MNKRNKIIAVIVFLALASIAGYLIAARKGILPKKNISYERNISEIQTEKSDQSNIGQEIFELRQEEAEPNKISPIDEKAASEKLQPSETPSKAIEKKIEEPAKKDDSNEDVGKIISKFVSWGFQKSSGRTIKAVIVHTSYNAIGGDVFDFDKVMQEWKDAGVSPHYAIDRNGTIYQLVADQNIAWHAGNSKLPDGTTDVNGTSIGIEVINSQDAKFTDAQYEALNSLLATLKKKYPVKYILGHDEIAPGRKTDPWGIEWDRVRK